MNSSSIYARHLDYDLVVIGGGISGLYTAHRVLQCRPNTRILVLEASPRHLGGRARESVYRGVTVQEGAGVGRCGRDYMLQGLLAELGLSGIPLKNKKHKIPSKGREGGTNPRVENILRQLRLTLTNMDSQSNSTKSQPKHPTFDQLLDAVLADKDDFYELVGYSDFAGTDAFDTLADYGFDFMNGPFFQVPWSALVRALARAIGPRRILMGTRVISIALPTNSLSGSLTSSRDSRIRVTFVSADEGLRSKGFSKSSSKTRIGLRSLGVVTARIVVTAVPPAQLTMLMPTVLEYRTGFVVHEFVRVYAEVRFLDGESARRFDAALPLGQMIHAPRQIDLQRVRVMKRTVNGAIIMIAYADSDRARRVCIGLAPPRGEVGRGKVEGGQNYLRAQLQQLLLHRLGLHALGFRALANTYNTVEISNLQLVPPFHVAHWRQGTHGFAPLDTAKFESREAFLRHVSRPKPGLLYAVGEALSTSQGWTQGALESVHRVLPDVLEKLAREG